MFAMMLWIFFVQLIAGFQPRPPLSVVRRHEHFVKLDPEVEAKTKKFGLEVCDFLSRP